MNVGFVAKDVMAARALTPIASAMERMGRRVVFLEGAAIAAFPQSLGTRIIVGPERNPEREVQCDAYWDALLRKHLVNVLVVGTSHPIHAERGLALAANRAKIPVAAFPDIWGGETRLGDDVEVSLWIGTDEAHRELLLCRTRPGASVVAAGSPMYELFTRQPPDPATVFPAGVDLERLLLVVGQGYAYLKDVTDAAVRLARTSVSTLMVPRLWHPKHGPNTELQQHFNYLVKYHCLTDRVLEIGVDVSTDTLAALCATTLSVFSTPLLVAAASGKRAISLHTTATREGMRQSTGLDSYPPASVSGPIYRWDVPAEQDKRLGDMPRGRYEIHPLAVEAAVAAIQTLAA